MLSIGIEAKSTKFKSMHLNFVVQLVLLLSLISIGYGMSQIYDAQHSTGDKAGESVAELWVNLYASQRLETARIGNLAAEFVSSDNPQSKLRFPDLEASVASDINKILDSKAYKDIVAESGQGNRLPSYKKLIEYGSARLKSIIADPSLVTTIETDADLKHFINMVVLKNAANQAIATGAYFNMLTTGAIFIISGLIPLAVFGALAAVKFLNRKHI